MRPLIDRPGAAAAIEWFATRQSGYVARRQLSARGLGRELIRRRTRAGILILEHRGVYRVAHRAPTPWAREMAAALACGPGALISHRSAARVHGMLAYPAVGDVWVTATTARGQALEGVRVRRTRVLCPDEVAFAGWLPLTSPARTLVDVAGVVDAERLERAVAEAQARGLVRENDLRVQLARSNGRKGARALRALLDRVAPPALTRSRAERLMLRLIRSVGLPEPLVNARLGRFRRDFYWPDYGVVAEFDGYEFHTNIAAFRRDREKSNEFQLMGITVLRFTWRDLNHPAVVEARLRLAFGLTETAC